MDLLKADGKTRPAPADIAPLLANSDVTAADTALTAAKTALRNACLDASEEPKLLVAQGKLVSEGLTEEVKKFNDSLIAFSKALGPELKAVISVVAPKAFGATTFDVLVEKSILEVSTANQYAACLL